MKWYKKQLEALLKKEKKTDGKDHSLPAKKGAKQEHFTALRAKKRGAAFASPVAQRNRNRDKTDLY